MFDTLFVRGKSFFQGVFFISLFVNGLAFGELKEACDVLYHGDVADLNKSTINVPEEVVALSSKVIVHTPKQVIEQLSGTPSIFFVIDHSGSMFQNSKAQDRWGERFKVAFALVDSIYSIFDSAEVGVAVFRQQLYYDPTDESRFVQTPKESFNGYLPLFKLDSSYAPDGKMGYEIIQEYLDCDTAEIADPFGGVPWKYMDLKYRPSNFDQMTNHTNINAGFHAAQHAFKSARHPKNRQFIIFLSDGKATWPDDITKNDYIEEVKAETPTTFTVFFTGNNNPPQDLVNMTNNIKGNGYSTSNEKSDLWTINVGPENLMDFLVENVLKVITSVIVSKPVDITIEGTKMNDFKNGIFTFDDHFPLKKETTPFSFEINYKVAKDTLVEISKDNWQTIVVKTDSSTDGTFKIKIVDGGVLPDSGKFPDKFTLECWDRGLSFYNGNGQIFSIDESMSNLKVRFDWKPGEAKYAYTNVTVELSTVAGNNQDKETFKLDAVNNYFIKDFKQEILNPGENPTPGDNTIQHYAKDSLVAIFRNSEKPRLVLDTLRESIPFRLGGYIKPICAYYYDRKFEDGSNGADGYIDSIFIRVETDIDNGITKEHLKEIMDKKLLVLPSFRGFTIKKYTFRKDGFAFEVDESRKHEPITYITKDDKVEVKELILKIGGWIKKNSIPIYDKVAPIIIYKEISYDGETKMTPLYIDYHADTIQDSLIVIFSEPVRKITQNYPFHFLDVKNNKQYDALLNDDDYINENQIIFGVKAVENSTKKMTTGDSIWIYEPDRVGDVCLNEDGDKTTNFQKKKKNKRRVINAVPKIVPINLNSISISPFDFKDIINGAVDNSIVELFDKKSLADLHLQPIGNDKFLGMGIQVIPNPEEIITSPYLVLQGTLSILDAVGNFVIKNKPMVFNPDPNLKTLNYIWNGKNSAGRSVGSGTYRAISHVTKWPLGLPGTQNADKLKPSSKVIQRFYLGVKK